VKQKAAIRKFQIGRVTRVKLRHCAEFCRNQSNFVAEILRFSIFQDGGYHYLGFSKFQISRGSSCVAMPNLVEIGGTVAEIPRFFDFSRWLPLPSWIFNFLKF